MYVLARRLKSRGMLRGDTVALTVMSNSGLVSSLGALGIQCVRTEVGDRFVYESMQNNNFSLGGEQSGHIVFGLDNTTGDGILSSVKLLQSLKQSKRKLSVLADEMEQYPQI